MSVISFSSSFPRRSFLFFVGFLVTLDLVAFGFTLGLLVLGVTLAVGLDDLDVSFRGDLVTAKAVKGVGLGVFSDSFIDGLGVGINEELTVEMVVGTGITDEPSMEAANDTVGTKDDVVDDKSNGEDVEASPDATAGGEDGLEATEEGVDDDDDLQRGSKGF